MILLPLAGYKRAGRTARTSRKTLFRSKNVTAVPTALDWRKKGAVTVIKDRGSCATEGINQLKTGESIFLSEQKLIHCDANSEDQGCEGGLMQDGFQFIINSEGLAIKTELARRQKKPLMWLESLGYEVVPANNEATLSMPVANHPVLVSIDVGGRNFQFYSTTVFTGDCETDLDHARYGCPAIMEKAQRKFDVDRKMRPLPLAMKIFREENRSWPIGQPIK
ncbi:hypothetical protein BT93_H1626 [Corymbia citriodora subsp. variegata]|nr:hypothetical protein BT93_H1626 [Corymbia citriodora subsp. variegata]